MLFINIKTELTEQDCERYRKLCNFTEDERAVFDLRSKGKSIIEISMTLPMAEATVNRRLKGIKNKISRVM